MINSSFEIECLTKEYDQYLAITMLLYKCKEKEDKTLQKMQKDEKTNIQEL